MPGRLSRSWLILGGAAAFALLLTITRPSPEGLIGFGVGDREVRAAPGQPATSIKKKHNLAKLEVINQTLIRVRDAYVDPSRIDPKEMLYSALDSVQFNIPEVLIEPDRAADQVVIHVNDKQQTFSTADVDSPWRLSKTLKNIFRFMEANMNPGADLAAVEYSAANGLLSTLDPHSVLLDPDMAREMDVNTGGEFGGLGIVIGMRDKKLTVIRPMAETPADRAGVKPKDKIIRINDELTENLTLNESVNRMRGKAGTKVTLWVERDGSAGSLRFDLVRDLIQVESVKHKLLSNNVGYIKIIQFAGRTAKETRKAIDKLTKEGATRFVLDLRWNPGGLLEQAIRVSDLFIDRGTLVTTVGGHEREAHRADRSETTTRAPLAVLINQSSASASEIVAGALKNLDRAVIIGSTSFGKGSVQILYDNQDGSKLKLTIAQYLTPGDLSIQSMGISPDVALQRMYVPTKNDSTKDILRLLPPSQSYREADLKAHLNSEYAKAAPKPLANLSFVYERPAQSSADDEELLEDEEPIDDEFVEDFEIRFARDLIASVGTSTRNGTLKNVNKALTKTRAAEERNLQDKLQKLGIDWSPAPASAGKPQLQASFALDGSPTQVVAGQEVRLVGTVTNTGTETAYRVLARVKADDPLFDDAELIFGKLAPGETRTWTSYAEVPLAALDRLDKLEFEVSDAKKSKISAAPVKFRIASTERPVFAYGHQLVDQSNGDGLVQRGEKHKLQVMIRNAGKGIAKDAAAILRNASGVDVVLDKARFEIGELKPGDEKTVSFEFRVAPETEDSKIVVELSVYDNKLGETVSEKLTYDLRPSSAGPAKSGGTATFVRRASVFEGAANDSALIATGNKGTTLRVTGKQGEWLRVTLDKGRSGFVHASNVKLGSDSVSTAGLDLRWQVTPPKLTVQVPSYETKLSTYHLKGEARDDAKIEDVYVFVSNPEAKVDNRKVFYASNRKGKNPNELDFEARIPLWPGSNIITVIARENDQVRSSHTIYMYRDGSATTAAAP